MLKPPLIIYTDRRMVHGTGGAKLFVNILATLFYTFAVALSGKPPIHYNYYFYLAIICFKNFPVSLVPSGSRTFCPGMPASFSCVTKFGALIWRSSSTVRSVLFEDVSQPSVNLGIFNVRVITVTKSGATVVEVNSTATVSSIQLSHDDVNLLCIESKNFLIKKEAVIVVLGEYYFTR